MTSVLVTNDDGIDSPGLHALAGLAADLGLQVLVAAPDRESSGVAASLAAVEEGGRVVVLPREVDGLTDVLALSVQAAPAFIVRAALHEAFGPAPDLVISGINKGPNTGHAVLHSGTVGAAMTAATYGRPALAVSLGGEGDHWHWDTAVEVARPVLNWLAERRERTVLNLNVPNAPLAQVRGLRRAPLASFGAVQAKVAEVGYGYVTLEYREVDPMVEPDSDAGLLARHWACVTPLVPLCEAPAVDLSGLDLHDDP